MNITQKPIKLSALTVQASEPPLSKSGLLPLTFLVGPVRCLGLTARHGGQGCVPLSPVMAWGCCHPSCSGVVDL